MTPDELNTRLLELGAAKEWLEINEPDESIIETILAAMENNEP